MIAIGSDHGGYELKQKVISYLEKEGIDIKDVGCDSLDSVDYPQYGRAVATLVASGECETGIVICSSGIGISIVANKVKGIRAALCTEPYTAKMTRLHNNANVLALGGKIVGDDLAIEIVKTFLNTEFSNEEKHIRRISQIEE